MEPKRCKATSKRSGEHCKAYAVRGAEVCRIHGGAAPQVQAAAQRNIVMAAAQEVIARTQTLPGAGKFAAAPVTDPFRALQHLAGEMLAVKDWIRGKIEGIEQIRTLDDKSGEQIRAELQAYMKMMDSCASVLAAIAKLNIEARMAAISEAQATTMIRAFEAVLAELRVGGDRAAQAKASFSRHLRAVPTVKRVSAG